MAKILNTPLPFATEIYDPQTMQLILTLLQRSLDDVDIPEEIVGEDEVSALSWFLS
jgi:hypothetical protein